MNVLTPEYYHVNGHHGTIDYIEAHKLNFNLGNVIKYVTRAGKKPREDMLTALLKARFYLDYEIDKQQEQEARARELE